MTSPTNAIAAKNLEKTYAATKKAPAKHALKGIDLSVPAGSIFGLLGPNGAGKSTFINILGGLVNKSAGEVSVWGFDIDANPRQARAAIGVVLRKLPLMCFSPRKKLWKFRLVCSVCLVSAAKPWRS